MSVADLYLTKEGIAKLKEELQRLKTVDRKEVITKIKEARLYGDLSENAEYHTARERQAVIEGRIEEITALLKKAKVIEHEITHEAVEMGSQVTVAALEVDGDKKDAYEETFIIVGSTESDPLNGHISAESPLGAALMGAKKGQTIEVPVPGDDKMAYKIKSIA